MRKLSPIEIRRLSASELTSLPRNPLAIVLDDIRSAYNVGAIFRTADAIRADRVVCCGYTPTPHNPSVAKTALGAEATVPWNHSSDPLEAIVALRERGFFIVALEQTDSPTPIYDLPVGARPVALVVGNEVAGVQQRVLDACDRAIEIPQYGAKASLNVAVAFGIAAYALLERGQRDLGGPETAS